MSQWLRGSRGNGGTLRILHRPTDLLIRFLLFELTGQGGAPLPARAAVPKPGPPSGPFTPLGSLRVFPQFPQFPRFPRNPFATVACPGGIVAMRRIKAGQAALRNL